MMLSNEEKVRRIEREIVKRIFGQKKMEMGNEGNELIEVTNNLCM